MPSGECSIEPWVFMNWRRAAYYLYLAEVIDAKKALEFGLVNEVVPREQLDDRVEAIARHIAQAPMTTLLATKANLKRAWELMGMRVHWQSSNDLVALASISKDVQELIQQVFKDKVLPVRAGPAAGRGGRIHRRRRGHARSDPLVNIADHASTSRGVAGPDRRWTAPISFGELHAGSQRVAAVLHERGCGAATAWRWSCRTVPSSSKSPGAASFPACTTRAVNTHFTPDEVAYVIDDSEAKAVFVDASMAELAEQIREVNDARRRAHRRGWRTARLALLRRRPGRERVMRRRCRTDRRCSTRRAPPGGPKPSAGRYPSRRQRLVGAGGAGDGAEPQRTA